MQTSALSYPRIFIAAGEYSGDRFGASLAEALCKRAGDVRLAGVGGQRMASAGVRVVADTTEHAGMGFFHTGRHIEKWARVFRRCVSEFNREPPDILVPIDNPGFNLKLAKLARERGIPVCYYVSPQVWAWLPHRIRRISRCVTRMMTILPFEKPLYDRLGVDCRYVGHPALDYLRATSLDASFMEALSDGKTIPVGLLPGSRNQEIAHTFPVICRAARIIGEKMPDVSFHVAAASPDHLSSLRSIMDKAGLCAELHIGRTPEIMRGSRICIVVSGTATLETAYYRTPMTVVYRAGAWAKYPARFMLHVPHICLVNIIGGREVVPEFLKFNDNPYPVAESALNLLENPSAWQACRDGLEEVMAALGPPGSSRRAAEAVLELVGR